MVLPPASMKRISLTTWILIGLVAGVVFGGALPKQAVGLAILGTIFLRLIKSIIAPLLFGTLVSGIAGAGSVKTMGRIGGKAILYFEIVTTVALFVGLGAVNLIKPGVGVQLQQRVAPAAAQTGVGASQLVEHAFPTSIIDAMAKGEVLQIVVFAFIFGAACATVGIKARPVVQFCESLSEVMFRFTNYVMLFAPIGVFGAMAATIGENGIGVLKNLGKLVLTLYGAEVFFVVVVLGSVSAIVKIPAAALHPLRARALPAGVLHGFERIRAADRHSRTWSGSACPSPSRRSCCRRDTASTWMGPRSTSRSPRCLWHAGRRSTRSARHAAGHDVDPHADEQGRGRRAAARLW